MISARENTTKTQQNTAAITSPQQGYRSVNGLFDPIAHVLFVSRPRSRFESHLRFSVRLRVHLRDKPG